MAEATYAGERIIRQRILVRGAVQGVGYRPFVYREARARGLAGWVANAPDGVIVEVEGAAGALGRLIHALRDGAPRHARVDTLEVEDVTLRGGGAFSIVESRVQGVCSTEILPDLATCEACVAELFDPRGRRYRYPFINCTQCGPRYSIAAALPYDRARTSMRDFSLCEACRREYEDPADRRFHAEPIACPACGPELALWDGGGQTLALRDDALSEAVRAIHAGLIVAVKGLGGFHLIVDARNDNAVSRLRQRKRREAKPFALMCPSLAAATAFCDISDAEAALLTGPEAPIVLLRRRSGAEPSCEDVAPGNPCLGVMLPYTPLHHLLMRELNGPVVATSGNLSDEPIATDEHDALRRLHGIADLFLVHDRPILRALDDSVARIVDGKPMLLRRARGYAPAPVAAEPVPDGILGLGGHMKATVAISVRDRIVLSPHIGDLDTPEARALYQRTVSELTAFYGVTVRHSVSDAHPGYFTNAFGDGLDCPKMQVQHHAAHVAACMAEHGLKPPVLGVAWDGTGYGTDGTVWGGEFLLVTDGGARRAAHLRPFRLPGGERAVREPRRAAFGLLFAALGRSVLALRDLPPVAAFSSDDAAVLATMCERGLNAPVTTSAGRLFDAVASLTGLRQIAAYEGEPACALEWAIPLRDDVGAYPFAIRGDGAPLVIDWLPALDALLSDLAAAVPAGEIAARFHNGLADAIISVAERAGTPRVALTGGCFQNRYLIERAIAGLRAAGYEPYWPQAVPPNDGGLAVGQIALAARER